MARLSVNDVAKIKRFLQEGNLTQKEIGKKFGVDKGTIARIKSGKTWSHIKINENGELASDVKLEAELKPENFPCLAPEDTEKDVNAVEDETKKFRLEFIESYFIKKVKPNPYDSEATYIHWEPVPKKSKIFVGALWNNYKWLFNNEWDEFISVIMATVTETVLIFEPKDKNFNFKKISIEGMRESGILHEYINKAIKTAIKKRANSINNTYKTESKGEVTWHKPIVESIDLVTKNENGEFPFIEGLGQESNLFFMRDSYATSHFLDWFGKEREDILTRGQIRFLGVIKYFQRDRDCQYTIPYSQLKDKPYSEEARRSYIKRIRSRVENAYANAEKKSLREMAVDRELEFWTEFIKIVEIEDDRIHEQNKLLSDWIKKRLDNDYVIELFDGLDVDDVKAIVSGKIESRVLYKVVGLVEQRVKNLKAYEQGEG